MVLAAEGGQHTLLPYLGRLLPEPMQYLAEHYRRVRVNPSYVTRFSALTQAYPEHEAQILSYGLRRLIWRDRFSLGYFSQATISHCLDRRAAA